MSERKCTRMLNHICKNKHIILQPYIDTKAGELEIWPSHASGQDVPTTSLMLTKSKGLVLVSDEQTGKPQLIPKPRFLEQLETFIKKELRALNVMEVKPSELRLQVMWLCQKKLLM